PAQGLGQGCGGQGIGNASDPFVQGVEGRRRYHDSVRLRDLRRLVRTPPRAADRIARGLLQRIHVDERHRIRRSGDGGLPPPPLEGHPDCRSGATPPGFRTRSIDMTLESNPEFWWPRLTARRTSAQEPYYYMRGRGMGGSSTVNGLCAIRGVPADYDRWAELGAAGWSFEEVLPFFIRLEDEHDFGDRS